MKSLRIIFALLSVFAFKAFAGDSFPIFSESPLKLTIPTAMHGYQPTREFAGAANAVYTFTGQIFTNANTGRLQSISEGFNGTTDKSTPWKTLTELLALYQRGSDEAQLMSLYTASSKTSSGRTRSRVNTAGRMKKYGLSVTGMQAVLGVNYDNGFVAFVRISRTGGVKHVARFYLVKAHGVYLLSKVWHPDRRIQNLEVFLNTHSAAELLR